MLAQDPLDTAKKEEYRLMQDKANFVKWIEQAKEKVKSAQVKVDQGKNARSHAGEGQSAARFTNE